MKNLLLAILTTTALSSAFAQATPYQATYLGILNNAQIGGGFTEVRANSINDAGEIVGRSPLFENASFEFKGFNNAFLWSKGNMSSLGNLGTAPWGFSDSNAQSINNGGQIAGSSTLYQQGQDMGSRAVRWSNGTMTELGGLGTNAGGYGNSSANAINNSGQIVGASNLYQQGQDKGARAVLWANGSITNLGTLGTDTNGNASSIARDVSNSGLIVGSSNLYVNGIGKGDRAVLWTNGLINNLGSLGTNSNGVGRSWASGINDGGQIVGGSELFQNGQSKGERAVLWRDGDMIDLGNLGADANGVGYSHANAINDADQIVGSSYFSRNGRLVESHAVISYGGSSFQDLNDLVLKNTGSLYDYVLTEAFDINESGQIVAVGYSKQLGMEDGYRAFLLTPVPEPETFALLLAGLGLLGIVRRRKVRQ